MTWFQVFINPIVQSTFQADAVRVNEDYLVAIASCFHVQNNAGECHRKSTFFYSVSSPVVPKMEEEISGTGAVKNSK